MTETIAENKIRPKRKWLKILLGLVGLFVVIAIFADADGPDIRVSYRGTWLNIQNTGNKDIGIVQIVVNDRDDCKVTYSYNGPYDVQKSLEKPINIKIGDTESFSSSCINPVRAKIVTTDGTGTYTFR
jgi:hypothetical protein